MKDAQVFGEIVQRSRGIRTLESVLELLNWDQETVMPPSAHAHRSEQQALIAGMIHQRRCDPHFVKLLEGTNFSGDEDVIVQRIRRDVMKAQKLPAQFVQAFTKATSEGFTIWQIAKSTNNWELFCPHIERIVELIRQKAEYYGYKEHPYDALLDDFEPETTTKEISSIFSPFKEKLLRLLAKVEKGPWYGKTRKPIISTLEEQLLVSKNILSFIGYDWNKGRLDTSEHPFSVGIHPTDCRLTIRRSSCDLLDQVMSALHEGGHGLYEMGLCQHHVGTPLSQPVSCSIHESQSRIWEIQIGRSKQFAPHLLRILRTTLGKESLPDSSDELYDALNRVECTPIRTKADDLTYPLHVIIRFEIEQELVTGALQVRDLPDRWNAGMKALLGITPKNDAEGCLQDVHWSLGSFGYFPSYTLGSLYAACFFSAMKHSLPNLEELITNGEFSLLHEWLYEHVWQHGRRFTSKELVTRSLGRPPTEDDYMAYLREKYLA